jgi:hypothetical protein
MRIGSRLTGVRCSAAKPTELTATQTGKGITLVKDARKKPLQKVCTCKNAVQIGTVAEYKKHDDYKQLFLQELLSCVNGDCLTTV